MRTCSNCNDWYPEEDLTEIGLGTSNFQCEECWDNYGEEI